MSTAETTITVIPDAFKEYAKRASQCERRFLEKYSTDDPTSIGEGPAAKLWKLRRSIEFTHRSEGIDRITKWQTHIDNAIEESKDFIDERKLNVTDGTLNTVINAIKESWYESNYPDTHTKTREVGKLMGELEEIDSHFVCWVHIEYLIKLKARDDLLKGMYDILKDVNDFIDGLEHSESDRNSKASSKKKRTYGRDRNSETTKKPRTILPKAITETASRPQSFTQASIPQNENVDTDTPPNSESIHDEVSTDEASALSEPTFENPLSMEDEDDFDWLAYYNTHLAS